MTKKISGFGLALFLIFNLAGCNNFKVWFAENFKWLDVTAGVARLFVQHLSIIINELKPAFEMASPVIEESLEPEEFGKGLVTWTLTQTDIEHQLEKEVYRDCLGSIGLWQGKLQVIEAKQKVYGRLTGNSEKPVIPDLNRVSFHIRANAQGLSIRFPSKEAGHLVVHSGELSFDAIPRLAQSNIGQSKGMRVIPTSNLRFENVRLKNVKATLHTPDITLPVDIDNSNFTVQVGQGENGEENSIEGTITILGKEYDVALNGKDLDPKYSYEEFLKTYICNPGLEGVVRYEHQPLERKLAPGMALSTLVMSQVLEKLNKNSSCGLASVDFLKSTKLSAGSGEMGEALSESNQTCEVTFIDFRTEPDCHGVAFTINGKATVTSLKRRLKGKITMDEARYQDYVKFYENLLKTNEKEAVNNLAPPAIPYSRQPAEVSLSADLTDLRIVETCVDVHGSYKPHHCKAREGNAGREKKDFTVLSGRINATFKPMLAKDVSPDSREPGVCMVPIPVSQAKITLEKVKAILRPAGAEFRMMANGSYEVVLGEINGHENELRGQMTIGRTTIEFREGEKDHIPLDPNYNRQEHLDSFLSCRQLDLPKSDVDCVFDRNLAANIMRLVVLNAGQLMRWASDKNTPNSFRSQLPSAPQNGGSTLILSADTDSGGRSLNFAKTDAAGNQFLTSGVVQTLTGTMKLEGANLAKWMNYGGTREIATTGLKTLGIAAAAYLVNKLAGTEKIKTYEPPEIFVRPNKPDSVSIEMSAVLHDFKTKFISSKEGALPSLNIRGLMAIEATPIMGLDKRTVGGTEATRYSIETPIVRFDSIELSGKQAGEPAILKLEEEDGMILPIHLKSLKIKAHNGFFRGKGNYLSGEIEYATALDKHGVPKYLPKITISHAKLDPKYDQEKFDASYRQTKNLYRPIIPTED